MKTTLIAIALAAATTMAVTPALAHCGGNHGTQYPNHHCLWCSPPAMCHLQVGVTSQTDRASIQ